MDYQVNFHPRAARELNELFDYIAQHGSPERASRFVGQIRDYCLGFAAFPERGTVRDDIAPGVRMVGFRRRVSIVFSVESEVVWVLGVYYGGRNMDLEALEDE